MAVVQELIDYIKRLVMPLVNNVVIAVFTFFIGLIVGRILGKLMHRILHAFDVDKNLVKAVGAKVSVESLAELTVSYITYFVFLIIALNQVGLTQYAVYVVTGVAGIVAVIATFLALKDVIPNAVAGVIIMRRQFPKVGEKLRLEGIEGKVSQITVLETRIKTKKGDLISLPNRQVVKSRIEIVGSK